MREPPKLYRPLPEEQLTVAVSRIMDSLEAVMVWIKEAVEIVEAAQQQASERQG
jgi:hypothetical protein